MTDDWQSAREVFDAAADWFVAMTGQVGDRWSAPGLGEWDVRALVGHTSRSLITVEAYLGVPAGSVDVESAPEYYLATRAIAAGPEVAERGRDAGRALGEDPPAAVAEIARRVRGVLAQATGDELVTTIAGGMRLSDYLPTRTFELIVHTLDLTSALGVEAQPPRTATACVLSLLGELALADGRAPTLLLAATGRIPLPPGFSLLSAPPAR